MDGKVNESSPSMSRHPEYDVVSPPAWQPGHVSPDKGGPNLPDRSPTTEYQPAQVLAYTSEMQEAKIRALQEAVESGSYHIPAEQIADKMLRDAVRELLS
jgi:hypothetical protein